MNFLIHIRTFSFLVLILSANFIFAQGLIRVDTDPAIERLSQNFIRYHKDADNLVGWRVQLLASTDRLAVEQARSAFIRKFPDYKIEWEYTEPFYRLRVGAFQSRLDANTLLIKLRNEYPGAVLTRVNNLKNTDFLMRQ